jgi:hypothetical protein
MEEFMTDLRIVAAAIFLLAGVGRVTGILFKTPFDSVVVFF